MREPTRRLRKAQTNLKHPKEFAVFSAFRSKTSKTPTPHAEIVGYDGETLELECQTALPVGPQTLVLLHAELELEKECSVQIDQGFPDKNLYWATLPEGSELPALLQSLVPKEAEMAAAGGEIPATWEEKRSRPRLNRILGAMSPQVQGFKCLTHDLHREGLRLQLDHALEPNTPIKVRFELEDHRLPPFDVQGTVKWCQENPLKGYWAGIFFTQIEEQQCEHIDKFVEETMSYEGGVLTRDYIS